MEAVKKTKDYTIFKKRSGRYAVQAPNKKWVNGEDKAKILLEEKLIKLDPPKKKEEAPAEEAESSES